jgi:hypothetical protein
VVEGRWKAGVAIVVYSTRWNCACARQRHQSDGAAGYDAADTAVLSLLRVLLCCSAALLLRCSVSMRVRGCGRRFGRTALLQRFGAFEE